MEIVYPHGPFMCAYCRGTMGRFTYPDGKLALQCMDRKCEMWNVKLGHPVHKLERLDADDKAAR